MLSSSLRPDEPAERRRQRFVIGEAAQVVEHGGKAEDGGDERLPRPVACARNSFHQSKFDPGGGRVGHQARAEMVVDERVEHQRRANRQAQRRQPESGDERTARAAPGRALS